MKFSTYIKPETLTLAHDMGRIKASNRDPLLLKGNTKTGYFGRMGYLYRTKGLPIHDCPDRTAACSGNGACYALMDPLFNLEKNKGIAHVYSYLAHNDMCELYDRLRNEIRALVGTARIKRSGLVIRIHEAGDFINAMHVSIYHWLASEFPQVQFFGYSRGFANASIRLALWDINQLPNVMIRESVDNTRPQPCGDSPAAFFGDDDKAPSKYFKCVEQLTHGTDRHQLCIDCGLCWTQRKTAVRFVQH